MDATGNDVPAPIKLFSDIHLGEIVQVNWKEFYDFFRLLKFSFSHFYVIPIIFDFQKIVFHSKLNMIYEL